MKRFYLLILLCSAISFCASSQIGYQVSLLNNATGEPRANERVTVTVKITDSEGTIVCEETKNKTSNDFGVVSMTIGDSETFANADWSKLPFFIEASVDRRLLGKSQLLSVPVAEHAKHTGTLTKEILCSKVWGWYDSDRKLSLTFRFMTDGSYILDQKDSEGHKRTEGIYYISGDSVFLSKDNQKLSRIMIYSSRWNNLFDIDWSYVFN